MTEMSPVSHITPYGDDNYGPIGRLLPGMVAKVISTETGELCGPGERGELCCKGPNIMKGCVAPCCNPVDRVCPCDPHTLSSQS